MARRRSERDTTIDLSEEEARDKERDTDRGREAERPSDIPARGWKDVLLRVKDQAKRDHIPLLSAGVALYILLALVPGLIAVISVYGLVADPDQVQRQISNLTEAAPPEVQNLLVSQLQSVAEGAGSGAILGVVLGLAGALWAASSGMKHLITAVNAVYDEEDDRGFLKLRGLALAFTGGLIALFVVAIGVIAVVPQLVGDLGAAVRAIARWVPYALLAVLFAVGLAFIYRYAPNRDRAELRWVSWGAVIATVLWIAASVGFSFYVANFGTYNETYGSLGAVIVLILWLLITAYAVLIGAEFNAEVEAQTRHDTTVGDDHPMGDRGAVKADELGEPADARR